MPISILGLERAREPHPETHAFIFDTLEDLKLTRPIEGQAVVTLVDPGTFLVHVSGSGMVRAECDRCLQELDLAVAIDTQVEFSDQPTEEQWPIEHNSIDLEPVVRDEVYLNLPMKQLCSQTCTGIAIETNQKDK